MNWGWAASIDQLWRSPSFPMWLTLAAAGFFAVILLITLLRAEKSVANGALTVITLLAIGIAVAATIRSFGPGSAARNEFAEPAAFAMPALACIDDLAGETVLVACEKQLFGAPDAVAAAVAATSARISRLTVLGDVAGARKVMTPELERLRRALERDRYGLVAYVLAARDHCQPGDCAAYRSLTDHHQIAANMEERVYQGLVQRYAANWAVPAAAAVASAPAAVPNPVPAVAGLPPSVPTGKPTTTDFPTAASIPPVNIMTPEPTTAPAPRPSATASNPPAAPAPATTANAQLPPRAAVKKPPKPRTPTPVPLAPDAASPDN